MPEPSPTDAELMNYLLGRPLDREVMARIAACKDCKSRMRELENRLLNEAEEMQGQSAGFGLSRPSVGAGQTGKRARNTRAGGKSRAAGRSAS